MARISMIGAAFLGAMVLACSGLAAQRLTPDVADAVYATVGATQLRLDIYLPKNVPTPYPVVVWIHGGGWQSGAKENPNGTFLVGQGFALVSINYRLTGQAVFPAQIHDCKGAIRWIRANAATYGLDPARIGVFGSSAGGHLVALLGTSGDVEAMEGEIGGNGDFSSRVQAVCDWYGPSNLPTMGDYPSGLDHRGASSPEGKLIGGAILENLDAARAASPITYVGPGEPPFLIQHGTADNTVPFHQSVELDSALRAADADVTFVPVVGGGHGPGFEADTVRARVVAFFTRLLKPQGSGVADVAGAAALTVRALPNPLSATGSLEVSSHDGGPVTVEIHDAIGRLRGRAVRSLVADVPSRVLLADMLGGMPALPAGFYMARVIDRRNNVRSIPMVIQ